MAERFSRFDDKVSGVNPFTVRVSAPTLAARAAGAACALVRLPLLLASLLCLAASEAAASSLARCGSPCCSRAVRRLCVRASARGALAGLGFGCGGVRASRAARGAVRARASPTLAAAAGGGAAVAAGDVLLVNSVSWVDVLALAALEAPVFAATSRAGGLAAVSLWAALAAAAAPRAAPATCAAARAPGGGVAAALAAAAAAGAPLAVAPEGARTNGRAVLRFTPAAAQLARALQAAPPPAAGGGAAAHVLALAYDDAPALTHGSAAAHALALACQARGSRLAAARLPAGCDPQPRDFAAPPPDDDDGAAADGGGGAADAPPASWPAAVRDALAQLLRARAVALGAKHFDEFVAVAKEHEERPEQRKRN
jgi:hypothetical protein